MTLECLIGKYVILRTYYAGVHAGILEYYNENTRHVILSDARRVFQFSGAFTLSELAMNGCNSELIEIKHEIKFSVKVPLMCIYETYEILPCSEKGEKFIRDCEEWTYEKEFKLTCSNNG